MAGGESPGTSRPTQPGLERSARSSTTSRSRGLCAHSGCQMSDSTGAIYYQDDFVTLYLGDCLTQTAWLDADVLCTDPPYGIGWTQGENKAAKSAARLGIANDGDTAFRDAVLDMWGTRPWLAFGSWRAPFPDKWRELLTWRKPVDAGVVGSTTGHRRDTEAIFLGGDWPTLTARWSSVIATNSGTASYLGMHPHAKPLGLLSVLIDRCPPGIIADPFAGSGSTLVAAKALGRKAIGVELEERYCEIAARRLAQDVLDFTGEAS